MPAGALSMGHMIQHSRYGAWLGAGALSWLLLAPACGSSSNKKRTIDYAPSDAGQTSEAGASNGHAGTGGRLNPGSAGDPGDTSAAGSGGEAGSAGSGGEAGAFDASCGPLMKNCELSNPDCETSVDTVTSC